MACQLRLRVVRVTAPHQIAPAWKEPRRGTQMNAARQQPTEARQRFVEVRSVDRHACARHRWLAEQILFGVVEQRIGIALRRHGRRFWGHEWARSPSSAAYERQHHGALGACCSRAPTSACRTCSITASVSSDSCIARVVGPGVVSSGSRTRIIVPAPGTDSNFRNAPMR